jgi:hypothetical protein
MAESGGADAVVGLRYDSSEITQSLSEVVAYGTAVTLNEVATPSDSSGNDDAAEAAEAGEAGEAGEAASETSSAEVSPLSPPDFSSGVSVEPPVPGTTQNTSTPAGQHWPPSQWPAQS